MDPRSPERYARQPDEECGLADAAAAALGDEGEITCEDDAFDIPAKNAPVERLHRWRQAALVLNASRRFRYTLDLKKEKEKEDLRRKIRTHAQVIRAAFLFKEAGEREAPDAAGEKPVIPKDGFPISVDKLTTLTREHDFVRLQEYGGVKGLSHMLKSNIERGIIGDESELLHRRIIFGANTYPQKKGRNFLVFLWEACQDLTLIILMVAAVISLVLGIKTEGLSEGWYDGGSIAFAVILVVLVTGYLQVATWKTIQDKRSMFVHVPSKEQQSGCCHCKWT